MNRFLLLVPLFAAVCAFQSAPTRAEEQSFRPPADGQYHQEERRHLEWEVKEGHPDDELEPGEEYPLMDRDAWLGLLGVTCWFLMLGAVGSRFIKNPRQAGRLLKIHKVFAWAAFTVATIHGVIALFG